MKRMGTFILNKIEKEMFRMFYRNAIRWGLYMVNLGSRPIKC